MALLRNKVQMQMKITLSNREKVNNNKYTFIQKKVIRFQILKLFKNNVDYNQLKCI